MLPQTFLSLARSNKLSIPFVQGKFNMGGTGALQFCGTHNLQLIVSRRHPSIRDLRGNQPDRRWGFTVVRRENPTAGRRSSLYTYLAPSGHILSFNAESIPGMPGQYPDAYKAPLEAGSLIKLYEYRMPRAQSALTLRPYYRLSLMLPNVALPIVLCERRAGFTARSLDTTLAGLTTRLDTRDRALEPGFPASLALRVGGQPFGVSVYAFRRGKAESYRAREGVLFTINGQKHAHFDDRFFMRKKVALPFLRESLLVMVDCSNLSGRQREDLFMNSRDRLREGRLKSMLEKELEGALREHPGLKKLNVTRRQEAIGQKIKRSRMLAKTLTDLLSRNPELATLLGSGTRIPNPFPKDQATTAFEGKKFPTFFRLRGRPPRSCQKKKRHAVHFETDASNDYFERDSEQGSFAVTSAGRAVDCRFTLFNGHGILSVPPDPSAVVGDVVSYRVKVTDPSRSPMDPFVEAWEVTVRPATEESRPRPKPRGNLLSLPEVYEVREADWRLHSFDRRSALSVVPRAGKAYTFFINMDNLFLLSEQKASREDVRILGERFKTALVLIGLALLRDSEDREQRDGHDGREEDVFSRIGLVGRALAPVLLPMIGHLGNLDVGE